MRRPRFRFARCCFPGTGGVLRQRPYSSSSESNPSFSPDGYDHVPGEKDRVAFSDEELYRSLTENPARTWKQAAGESKAGPPHRWCGEIPDGLNRMMRFSAPAESIRLYCRMDAVKLFDEDLLLPGYPAAYRFQPDRKIVAH